MPNSVHFLSLIYISKSISEDESTKENGRWHEIKLIHNHGFIITTSAQTGEARPKNMHEHIVN